MAALTGVTRTIVETPGMHPGMQPGVHLTLRLRGRDDPTPRASYMQGLLEIKARIDGVWNDRNSKRLLKWICQAEAFEAKVISTGNRDGVGEEFRALLEKLTRILSNPLKPFLLDNPLAEGDFLWGETLLTRIQARTEVSLYTGRAFEVRPHEPLRAIRSWAERFFPNLFTHVMPPNEQEPLSAEELEVLRKSARLVVKLNEEHNAHQADKARLASHRQAARTTGLEMIRQMEAAFAHGERQLDRAYGEIGHLNRQIDQQRAVFDQASALHEAALNEERERSRDRLRRMMQLELTVRELGTRVRNLEEANVMLSQSLQSAHARLDSSDDGCSIM